MAHSKRIICLANSRKLHGRCVAGIELPHEGEAIWLRPVSARPHQEVSERERQYQDGSDPRVMDILDVPLVEPLPEFYQQENWLLDPNQYWSKVRVASFADLESMTSPASPLWIDGHSTYNGFNDYVPLLEAQALTNSLRLIHATDLELRVFSPGAAFGNPKRRVQGRFSHGGARYHLWVTDPGYEKAFLAQADGTYEIGTCYLTVSLGEAHEERCYKLIATIMQPSGGASE